VHAYFRWFERVTLVIVVISGVGAAIGSIVAVATGRWSLLPGQLAITLAFAFMLTVRRRA
jgi:hypothetical protein